MACCIENGFNAGQGYRFPIGPEAVGNIKAVPAVRPGIDARDRYAAGAVNAQPIAAVPADSGARGLGGVFERDVGCPSILIPASAAEPYLRRFRYPPAPHYQKR